jgi:UDP-glucose 4-epimerase
MILVTGGLGYIGSHMAAILMANGHEVILVDNLSNTKMEVLERLEFMAGRYVTFIRQDIRNTPALQRIFEQYSVQAVVHCAGMKSIPDSLVQPLDYYNNNLTCTTSLLRAMQRSGVKTLVFSSSLAVYGADQTEPVLETQRFVPSNPYSKGLQMSEQIIHDITSVDTDWRIAIMRYGNVAGAYPTAIIGEWLNNIPNNLVPFVAQTARQERDFVEVYGDEFDTADGTAVRDFVHVMDVVESNMYALGWLFNKVQVVETFNIARGEGVSVKQVIDAFSKVSEQNIAQHVLPPRNGDVVSLVANTSKAKEVLKWQATRGIDVIMTDMWRFYQSIRPIA